MIYNDLMDMTLENVTSRGGFIARLEPIISLLLDDLKIKQDFFSESDLEVLNNLLVSEYQVKIIYSNEKKLEQEDLMDYFEHIAEFESPRTELILENSDIKNVIDCILEYNISICRLSSETLMYIINTKNISDYICKYEQNSEMINKLLRIIKGLIFYMPREVSKIVSCNICDLDNGDKGIKAIAEIDDTITEDIKKEEFRKDADIPYLLEIYNFYIKLNPENN